MRIRGILCLWALLGLTTQRADARAKELAQPQLDDVLRQTANQHKPALIDFGAVWCEPCKRLEQAIAKPEMTPLLSAFVFQRYDAERGAGLAAAQRYGITGFPTLLILDAEGHELQRATPDPPELAKFLKEAASRATLTEPQILAQLKQTPEDVALLWTLLNRARLRGDNVTVRATLLRIEAADHTPEREDAKQAGWQRLVLESRAAIASSVVPLAADYLHRYPTSAAYTLRLLCAAGANAALIDRELRKNADSCKDADCLASLVSLSFFVGARDTALPLAKLAVERYPDSSDAYSALTTAYAAKGERALAKAAADKALQLFQKKPPADLSPERLKREEGRLRYERTALDQEELELPRKWTSLDNFLDGETPFDKALEETTARDSNSPEQIAMRLFQHEAATIALSCRTQAGKLDQAYIRVRIGTPPHISAVEILEPAASPALKRCLDKALRAVAVPAASRPATIVLAVSFADL